MSPDRGLEATRAIREKISREHDNDPRRLVAHYMRYQEQFADRLRPAPRGQEPAEPTDARSAGAATEPTPPAQRTRG